MSYKSKENLIAALESFSQDGSFAAANRAIGASANGTIWRWVAEAKKAKEENDKSFYWVAWRECEGWWVDHALRARSEQVLALDGLVREQVAKGIESVCYNPVDGRPLVALNPAYAPYSQEQFDALRDELDQPLDPRDRYLWEDEQRRIPIYQTKVEQVPASLRQKAMSAVVPGWGEHVTIDQNVRQAITIVAPAPWQPKAAREPALDVGELQALPAPPTVEQLRAERKAILLRQAEAHLADPNRVTKATMPTPPYQGSGRPSDPRDPPERAGDRDAVGKAPEPAAPYSAPRQPASFPQAPQGPLPSYVRRQPGQPHQGVRQDGSREPVRVVKR